MIFFTAGLIIWCFMQRKKVLYLDVCLRKEKSRTRKLAEAYLEKLQKNIDIDLEKICLDEKSIFLLNAEKMIWRDECIAAKDFENEYFDYAHKVAGAEIMIIAAPYWDFSFPALLKLFCEQICINNLTFAYQSDGCVRKLNKIEKVVYITTSGGYIGENNFGFEYIKGLFKNIFSVNKFDFYSAEGLDIAGADVDKLLHSAQSEFKL